MFKFAVRQAMPGRQTWAERQKAQEEEFDRRFETFARQNEQVFGPMDELHEIMTEPDLNERKRKSDEFMRKYNKPDTDKPQPVDND